MKYIISENKINESIYQYIDSMLKDKVIFSPGYDYTKDEETNDLLYFHLTDDLGEVIWDDPAFEYIKKSWYESGRESLEVTKKWENKAPILQVTNLEYYSCCNFDKMFGKFWRPSFEKWFENNFPQFPVKTFTYN